MITQMHKLLDRSLRMQMGSVLFEEQGSWSVQQVFAVTMMVAWQKLPGQHLADCRCAPIAIRCMLYQIKSTKPTVSH